MSQTQGQSRSALFTFCKEAYKSDDVIDDLHEFAFQISLFFRHVDLVVTTK